MSGVYLCFLLAAVLLVAARVRGRGCVLCLACAALLCVLGIGAGLYAGMRMEQLLLFVLALAVLAQIGKQGGSGT